MSLTSNVMIKSLKMMISESCGQRFLAQCCCLFEPSKKKQKFDSKCVSAKYQFRSIEKWSRFSGIALPVTTHIGRLPSGHVNVIKFKPSELLFGLRIGISKLAPVRFNRGWNSEGYASFKTQMRND